MVLAVSAVLCNVINQLSMSAKFFLTLTCTRYLIYTDGKQIKWFQIIMVTNKFFIIICKFEISRYFL